MLDYANGNEDKMVRYVAALRDRGIEVTDVDINNSGKYFVPLSDTKIGYPLTTKGVKAATIDAVLEERAKHGDYQNLVTFLARNVLTIDKSSFNSWANCGVFQKFGFTKSTLVAAEDDIFKRVLSATLKKKVKEGKLDFDKICREIHTKLFNGMKQRKTETFLPKLKEFSHETRLRLEKEYLGHYLTGNPLEPYKAIVEKCRNETRTSHRFVELSDFDYEVDEDTGEVITGENLFDGKLVKFIACIDSVRVFTTKHDDLMCVLHVIDLNGGCEIILWPDIYTKFLKVINQNDVYEFTGEVSMSDDNPPQVILHSMDPVSRSSVQQQTCTFYVNNKFEASNVCKLLLQSSKLSGDVYPTYLQSGKICILIPEKYSINRNVLNRLDSDVFQFKIQ